MVWADPCCPEKIGNQHIAALTLGIQPHIHVLFTENGSPVGQCVFVIDYVRDSSMFWAIEISRHVNALFDCHAVVAHRNLERVAQVKQNSYVFASRFFEQSLEQSDVVCAEQSRLKVLAAQNHLFWCG